MKKKAPKSLLSRLKQLSSYPATLTLLLICVLIQIAATLFPDILSYLVMDPSQPWGLITYQFAHAGWWHLIGNFMFGLPFMALLERKIGSARLALWYVLCGCTSAYLFQLLTGINSGLIGSSGSISGMALGACLLFNGRPLDRAIAAFYGAILLVMQVQAAVAWGSMAPVAYWGHVGGMLGAILLVMGDRWTTKPSK